VPGANDEGDTRQREKQTWQSKARFCEIHAQLRPRKKAEEGSISFLKKSNKKLLIVAFDYRLTR
jgi:hypothetical protein